MSETEQTRKLREQFKRGMPSALVFKVADRFTVGIPDFSIVKETGFTAWLELKYIRTSVLCPVFELPKTPQYVNMLRLGLRGVGIYVIYIKDGPDVWLTIWRPDVVDRLNSGKFVINLTITTFEQHAVEDAFELNGVVCASKNIKAEPLFWILSYLERRFRRG